MKFAAAAPVLVALALSGCGGGSETRLAEAERDFRSLRAKLSAVEAKERPLFDASFRTGTSVLRLKLKKLRAEAGGNEDEAHELGAALLAAEAREDRQRRRAAPLFHRQQALLNRLEGLRKEIESLKGCGKACRAGRERSAKLGIACLDSMIDAGVEVHRATEVCRRRHPLPNEHLLP